MSRIPAPGQVRLTGPCWQQHIGTILARAGLRFWCARAVERVGPIMQSDDRVSRYRRFAAACLALARQSGDPSKRALYVSMAQNWIELAKCDFNPEFEKALEVFNRHQLGEEDLATGVRHG